MTAKKVLIGLVSLVLLLLSFGCKQQTATDQPAASTEAKETSLPKFSLKDDTSNLLLTWVDEKGDFHVVQKPADVPEGNRKQVRVVITTREEGTGDTVVVADLTHAKADGTYPLETMPRAKWDEIGAKRRKARLEALAPSAKPPPSASPPAGGAQANGNTGGGPKLSAIIYGAEWCKPCHAAEAYLKQRGVQVVKKDIDSSEAARAEMNQKLAKAGMGGSQIPIIDLMGQLLIGYSPTALDRAIQSARKATTL